MLSVTVNQSALRNIKNLEEKINSFPNRIANANEKAVHDAALLIQENLKRRGGAGKFVAVYYKRVGKAGVKLIIQNDPAGHGGRRGTGGQKRMYSVLWATRIFLNSEEGKIGRRATVQGPRRGQGGGTRRYVISRTSGRWKKGTKLKGPLKIPQINPFHFSTKHGMKREKISTTSRKIMVDQLTKRYKNIRLK
jgi:hypothetical protein